MSMWRGCEGELAAAQARIRELEHALNAEQNERVRFQMALAAERLANCNDARRLRDIIEAVGELDSYGQYVGVVSVVKALKARNATMARELGIDGGRDGE